MEAADSTPLSRRRAASTPKKTLRASTDATRRDTLRRRLTAAAAAAILVAGCRIPPVGDGWPNAERTPNRVIREGNPDLYPLWDERFAPREELFEAEAWARQGMALEEGGDCVCVDAYYHATVAAWKAAWRAPQHCPEVQEPERARKLYHACLAKLISTGQKFHRLDPRFGLTLRRGEGEATIPVAHEGFAWTKEDFNHLELVGEYRDSDFPPVRWCGWGVKLVAQRKRCDPGPFFRHTHSFAATAMLVPQEQACDELAAPIARPVSRRIGGETVPAGPAVQAEPTFQPAPASAVRKIDRFVLKLMNPAQMETFATNQGELPLAGDLSAPLAWFGNGADRDYLTGFLRPGRNEQEIKLIMLEPYQRGKIPVVLVHGLLSDPATWVPATNAILADKRFREKYQIWAFRYPTGQAFLVSAAAFRKALSDAAALPGAADDPARMQTVLVGHSMGGLISKLQVVPSGNAFWDLIANRPLDEIVASDEDRQRLREIFYFEPRPDVRRVVYIGTPHRGASSAARLSGKVLSGLVSVSGEAEARQKRLSADNPGVFKMGLERRIPTSVDLLEPSNPLIQLMAGVHHGPAVESHTIIGDFRPMLGNGWGDGVVPVSSARSGAAISEQLIPIRHVDLHHSRQGLAELHRILDEHLATLEHGGWSPAAAPSAVDGGVEAVPAHPIPLPSPQAIYLDSSSGPEEIETEVLRPTPSPGSAARIVEPPEPAETIDFIVPPFEVE